MRKVVVTGFGVKVPGAGNIKEFKELLCSGKSALKVIDDITPNNIPILAGVVEEDISRIRGRKYHRSPRVCTLALAALDEAMNMAQLNEETGKRIAVVSGTAAGGIAGFEKVHESTNEHDIKKVPLFGMSDMNFHSLSSSITAFMGQTGLSLTLTTGCNSGADAILLGKLLIESGMADICVVAGSEAPNTRTNIFSYMRLASYELSTDLTKAGIPFNPEGHGFILSEGSGVLILESENSAQERGVEIYGVVTGVSSNNDGLSIFKPSETGNKMLEVVIEALQGKTPSYVNSQALGMQPNDGIERYVHEQLFDASVPITSIKGAIGHPFGAAGVVQAISGLLSIKNNFIFPVSRAILTDGETLPIVTKTMEKVVDSVLVTSHGYGGNNSAIYLTRG